MLMKTMAQELAMKKIRVNSISPGARPNDLVHVRVVLEVDDIDGVVAELMRSNAGFISPGVVTATAMAVEKCALVKDPDGHAVMLVQRPRALQ